jgi:hypothetical protein
VAQEEGKEFLLYDIGNDALALLKKQYINFGNVIIHLMILHLGKKMAIKMTTSQKFEFKAKGYGKQWDPTTSMALTSFKPLMRTAASQQTLRK